MTIKDIVKTEEEESSNFIQNIVLRNNADARGIILNIVPIVLRVNIDIIDIDPIKQSPN